MSFLPTTPRARPENCLFLRALPSCVALEEIVRSRQAAFLSCPKKRQQISLSAAGGVCSPTLAESTFHPREIHFHGVRPSLSYLSRPKSHRARHREYSPNQNDWASAFHLQRLREVALPRQPSVLFIRSPCDGFGLSHDHVFAEMPLRSDAHLSELRRFFNLKSQELHFPLRFYSFLIHSL